MLPACDRTLPRRLGLETLRSGTLAALAMIPPALAFFVLGLRINEYGIRVVQLVVGGAPRALRMGLFALEHVLISWSVTLPLLVLLVLTCRRFRAPWVGLAYGAAFYVAVNSLVLPWLFGDATPWQLGAAVVLPSLLVHLVFGLSVAWTSRAFVAGTGACEGVAARA